MTLASIRALRLSGIRPLVYPKPLGRLDYTRQLSRYQRLASTVTQLEHYPAIGEALEGFVVQQKKHVSELHLTAIHLKHDQTGADYLHVARDDKNNVFSIGFKTNPPDATGVPHILEHTTLCGSEK
jgi:hypothetical protein